MQHAQRILAYDFETPAIEGRKLPDRAHMVSWQWVERDALGKWAPVGSAAWTDDMETFGKVLEGTPYVSAHNGEGFDFPLSHKLFPEQFQPEEGVDTLLLVQMLRPDNPDGHSLAAVAPLVDEAKLEYTGDERIKDVFERRKTMWAALNPSMVQYGIHDTVVQAKLLAWCLNEMERLGWPWESVRMEHEVAREVRLVQDNGVKLDEKRALLLRAGLEDAQRRIKDELQSLYYPNIVPMHIKDPKPKAGAVLMKEWEVIELCRKYRIETPEEAQRIIDRTWKGDPDKKPRVHSKFGLYRVSAINLGSRPQIEARLRHAGWKPTQFTPKSLIATKEAGDESLKRAKLDEEVLEHVDLLGAPKLVEFYKAQKYAALVESWLKAMDKETGRVHGRILSIGAPTARMSHFNPNLAQVPKVGNWMGQECRECFGPDDGWTQLGVDASGLEFRMLLHYALDEAMTAAGLTGDIHQVHADLLGISRADAKTFLYAWLFGAQPAKLGSILKKDAKAGRRGLERMFAKWPGVRRLVEKVEHQSRNGTLPGLDGRVLFVRKKHAALNTLLQSAGAIVMKKALLLFVNRMREEGLEFRVVLLVHDEIQAEVRPHQAERAAEIAVWAIAEAGKQLKVRVPLAGEAKLGASWAATH